MFITVPYSSPCSVEKKKRFTQYLTRFATMHLLLAPDERDWDKQLLGLFSKWQHKGKGSSHMHQGTNKAHALEPRCSLVHSPLVL